MKTSSSPSALWSWATIPILLLAILLALDRWTQPPSAETLKPKVFVLGLSKTGTTSIGDALQKLGYRRLGWRDVRSRHLVQTFTHGDLKPLVELTHYFDAFEDLPWPLLYCEMAEMYPDAKFILSMRKTEETWLRSMRTHMGRGKWLPYSQFYGADTMDGNEDIILESYVNHTKKVREYFRDKPHRYVELNIDDGDVNWRTICQVAQCPDGKVMDIKFPKSNSVASWEMGYILDNVRWSWGFVVTRVDEFASEHYYASGRTVLRALLGFGWNICDVVDRAWTEFYFQLYLPAIAHG